MLTSRLYSKVSTNIRTAMKKIIINDSRRNTQNYTTVSVATMYGTPIRILAMCKPSYKICRDSLGFRNPKENNFEDHKFIDTDTHFGWLVLSDESAPALWQSVSVLSCTKHLILALYRSWKPSSLHTCAFFTVLQQKGWRLCSHYLQIHYHGSISRRQWLKYWTVNPTLLAFISDLITRPFADVNSPATTMSWVSDHLYWPAIGSNYHSSTRNNWNNLLVGIFQPGRMFASHISIWPEKAALNMAAWWFTTYRLCPEHGGRPIIGSHAGIQGAAEVRREHGEHPGLRRGLVKPRLSPPNRSAEHEAAEQRNLGASLPPCRCMIREYDRSEKDICTDTIVMWQRSLSSLAADYI